MGSKENYAGEIGAEVYALSSGFGVENELKNLW